MRNANCCKANMKNVDLQRSDLERHAALFAINLDDLVEELLGPLSDGELVPSAASLPLDDLLALLPWPLAGVRWELTGGSVTPGGRSSAWPRHAGVS